MISKITGFGSVATARQAFLKSRTIDLPASTVITVNLPDFVSGFALRPAAEIRFAVGETVDTQGSVATGTSIPSSAFRIGGIAEKDNWEIRTIEAGQGRTITLISATASTVDFEVF